MAGCYVDTSALGRVLLGEPDAPAGADGKKSEKKLAVAHLSVDGNTQLKEEELRRYIAPMEGKDLTLAQMKELAKDITTLYQRNGYYLSRAIIPVQPFNTDADKAIEVAALVNGELAFNRAGKPLTLPTTQTEIRGYWSKLTERYIVNLPVFGRIIRHSYKVKIEEGKVAF